MNEQYIPQKWVFILHLCGILQTRSPLRKSVISHHHQYNAPGFKRDQLNNDIYLTNTVTNQPT